MAVPEGLRERLGSADEEARHGAVLELRHAGTAGLPLLALAVGDPSWRVRKAALDVLLAAPGPEVLGLLIAGLRDEGNAGRRNSSMEALIRLGGSAVPALAPLLADPDPDLRKFVVDTLGNVEAPGVPDLLRSALGDQDENVAAAAAEFLGRRRVAAAVPQLLERLRGGGPWLVFGCLRALGEIGDPAAVPAVTRLLAAPGLRKAALEALGRIGGEESVPHLLDALFSRDRALRRAAAVAVRQVLARLGGASPDPGGLREAVRRRSDPDLLAFLRELIAQPDPELRAAAATLLGLVPGAAAVEIILAALPDAAEREQEQLAGVLEGLPPEELPLLIPRLLDPAPPIRLRAAQVLGRRGCRAAVPALLTLLEDATGHVRGAAAAALGAIGDPVATAALTALLRDPFPDVRESAMEAIVALGRRGEPERTLVLALLEPHLAAAEEDIAAAVIRIAGRLRGGALAPRLAAALRDDRGEVRRAAAEALGAIGGPAAVEALRTALTDEDVAVRREAVVRLGVVRDAAAVPLLLPMLQDDDLWVRVRTVQALAAFEHPAARAALLEAARRDPPGPKRLAAVRALGLGRVPGGLAVLTDLAGAPDRETRMAAVEALGALGDPGAVPVLLPLLADGEWGLRVAAVKALGPFAAREEVRAALAGATASDADALVRSSAAGALARAGVSPG
jgi:HEAT repeat protein